MSMYPASIPGFDGLSDSNQRVDNLLQTEPPQQGLRMLSCVALSKFASVFSQAGL